MKNSAIEWTDHTFNPWIGCTKVSPGCAHCYAETLMDTRYGRVRWGAGNQRSRTSEGNWRQPLRWNDAATRGGPRPRVFCASLADWLDDEVPVEWLADLLGLVRETSNLDWLLLTKRPYLWAARLEAVALSAFPDRLARIGAGMAQDWFGGDKVPPNVWVGTTAEDQQRADERIPELLNIPARVRFLSCEPLLSELSLARYIGEPSGLAGDWTRLVDWVIVGGESGPGARRMHEEWVRSLRDQCTTDGVAFFFKQWGKQQPGRKLDGHEWSEVPTP